jgi:hypothetical protein
LAKWSSSICLSNDTFGPRLVTFNFFAFPILVVQSSKQNLVRHLNILFGRMAQRPFLLTNAILYTTYLHNHYCLQNTRAIFHTFYNTIHKDNFNSGCGSVVMPAPKT